MDISIFGYKVNLEILILIGIVYLILVGHLFCGCCHYNLLEGLENATTKSADNEKMDDTSVEEDADMLQTQSGNGDAEPAGNTIGSTAKDASTKKTKEGFVGANINYGQSSAYDLDKDTPIDTNKWSLPDLVIKPGQPWSPAVRAIEDRPEQPIPLPEGELFMFANTPFRPECCGSGGSSFSNGSGCACMTVKQYNYLTHRGGNNVPFSQF